jgi:galactokinase
VAILCARDQHCGLFGYLPASVKRYIPWPSDYLFAIGVSGVEATKTGNARDLYNRTSNSLRALLAAWNAECGTDHRSLQAALDSSTQAESALRQIASRGLGPYDGEYLGPRFEQYLEESRSIVPGAADALQAGDLQTFSRFVERSQSLAETGLRNQVPETCALVSTAKRLGAVAASAFGAGFGGAVWSMVARDQADEFLKAWRSGYLASFSHHAQSSQFFLTSPGGPSARCEQPESDVAGR